jgi:hypothetical protein
MSAVVIAGDSSGTATIQAPAIAGSITVTTPAVSGTMVVSASPNYMGFKNRIINGAMVIDQRNGGTASTPTANAYVIDRWNFLLGGDPSKVTIQQNAGAVTPPAGFTNYIGATVATAVASPNTFRFVQVIEGSNIADLAWGTASAVPITLSFWVRSSLTGTFGGAITNRTLLTTTVSYPFTYTITSADTWQYVTITIPGDTTGTWESTNSVGMSLFFSLGEAATFKGTAGTWQSGSYFSATGTINLVNTLDATFYVTGVQIEAGTTATTFDYRSYGQELALCQRYYYKMFADSSFSQFGLATSRGTTQLDASFPVPVTMRIAPSVLDFSTLLLSLFAGGGSTAVVSAVLSTTNNNRQLPSVTFTTAANFGTAGAATQVIANDSISAFIAFGAEF